MAIQVVILAAGMGKRMHSHLPKVLHRLAGKPLLAHVITTALTLSPDTQPIIIYGHQGEMILEAFTQINVRWVKQSQQLGTGHALLQALPEINSHDQVLVLYGDVPLISHEILQKLITTTPKNALGLLTAKFANPSGYGRIIRDENHQVCGVIEDKDANENERKIKEINPGIYFVPAKKLQQWLPTLKSKNAQGEYYLTDIIALAVKDKMPIHAIQASIIEEVQGVNDRKQLADLERYYQQKQAEKLLLQGVTLYDPKRFDVRGELQVGRDVTIDVNVICEGEVIIGDGCIIGPNVYLRNTQLHSHVEVKANSVIDGAEIASHSQIGPFARIRPKTVLAQETHIGNFVEIKNSQIAEHSKVNHLSYIGDCEIGKWVNVGAGTITCNYDGANKLKTIIGDNVHIGSDTQLVAPVNIGAGATIAAGSTVTKDAPPAQLTLTHCLSQRTIKDWKRPKKIKK